MKKTRPKPGLGETLGKAPPLLEVAGVTIDYPRKGGAEPVLGARNVSFWLDPGEVMALVGATGSGKTTLTRALGGLLPRRARVLGGTAVLSPGINPDGRHRPVDLLAAPARQMRLLRRERLAYLTREFSTQLNPLLTIRRHIREAVRLGRRSIEFAAEAAWMPVLYDVGLVEPETLLDRFPAQVPGIALQRLLVAMALMRGVEILIADEPTSSLDAAAGAQFLRLLDDLRKRHRLAILFVTHSFGAVRGFADRVAVLFEGGVIETGLADQVLNRPKSDYTRALLDCVPRLGEKRARLGEVDRVAARDAAARVGAVEA
ncbi:MAG: ABC transporter ATP-binding protein [Akkermansiaceae bacterium]|nr:ABC transporter ATP-binding protein [Akkermansiaceae bacterium]MCP5551485.1 ABC transporter ATP-binding protein [Akkermansiaceae bacterium]